MLITGPKRPRLTVALAHGAGAPMNTPFLTYFAEGFGKAGYRCVRFEFPYMAARRSSGTKKPPDRQPILLEAWRSVVADLGTEKLIIGGKSMGGRMASLIADEMNVRGLLCLGYPFYGAGNKNKPRIEHLLTLRTRTLICQGEHDPMGNRESISRLKLAPPIDIHWLPDGDHDLKPRRASGRTQDDNLANALNAALAFLAALG